MRKLFIAGLLCVGLTACGDDDKGSSKSSSASGDQLTKAEMIARGDALCRDFNEESDRLDDDVDKIDDPSAKDVAPFFEKIEQKGNQTLEEFRALNAPDEDKAVLDDYLDAQERVLSTIGDVTEAAKDDDEDEMKRLIEENEDIDKEPDRLAKQYGFKVCGD